MNDNIRLLVDRTNKSDQDVMAELVVDNSIPILEEMSNYELIVEKLEVPTNKLPLNIFETPLQMVLFVDKDPKPALLQKYSNVFDLPNKLYINPDEIIEEINWIINKHTYDYPLGNFQYDEDKKKFKFVVKNENNSTNIWILFDSRLKNMLDHFSYDSFFLSLNNVQFHKFNQPSVLNTEVFQKYDTRSRFYQFKSVRVLSTLPTTKFRVYNQNLNSMVATNILTEIIIDSSNYNENQDNVIYIPNAFKNNSLTGTGPIQNFDISFLIHYSNGKDYMLTVSPSSYISICLNFVLKNKEKIN